MKCSCNTKKKVPCQRKDVRLFQLDNTGTEAHVCTKHIDEFRNGKTLDFHTTPVPVVKTAQQEIPFRMSRSDEIIAAQKAKQELEDAVSKSRVVQIINEGEEGMHKADEDVFIVAGTGSRSLQTASHEVKVQAHTIVETEIKRLKEKYGDRLVIMSGMAEGFDKLLAVVAKANGVKLWAAIPNHGYADYYWGRNSLTGTNRMEEFNSIISGIYCVTYVTEKLYVNGRHSNFIRNDWMVEKADAFLVWDPSTRGTADAFRSILAAGKPYKLLNTEVK